MKQQILSAVSRSHAQRRSSWTGFSHVPCAFFDMSDSSPRTGSVSGLEPASDIIGAAKAGKRHAAARASMRTLTSFMVWRVLEVPAWSQI